LSKRPAAESGLLSLKVTVLGSGTSHGVPSIGCDCAVCRSSDPKDRRTRPSILIEIDGGDDSAESPFATAVRSILVDTSTDLRMQALANDVRRVDAILFTHSHADHVFGLDDVRRYNQMQQTAIPCFADEETLANLTRMFSYVFNPPTQKGGGVPQLSIFRIAGPFSLGGVEVVPVPLFHGRLPVLGFRIGSFAYLTDCNRIPDRSWALLDGVRTVILDALRQRPHSTHFSVGEAIEVVGRLHADTAYFTHICHDLGHAETNAQLPAGVQLAYDGLVLTI
jgi:phosphoribosyl 1,2-cyclic phosphate phosphodiesterase